MLIGDTEMLLISFNLANVELVNKNLNFSTLNVAWLLWLFMKSKNNTYFCCLINNVQIGTSFIYLNKYRSCCARVKNGNKLHKRV